MESGPMTNNDQDPANTQTHVVRGMSCSHCVASVTEAVAEIPGVTDVAADLDSGRLTVTGDKVEDAAVAAAVNDAGYELAS